MSEPLKSLTDALRERTADRMNTKPDKYTLAWWDKRFEEISQAYRGATHSINLSVANTRDHEARLIKFQERVDELVHENLDLKAAMGSLQAELVTVTARLDKFAAWAQKRQGSEAAAKQDAGKATE